mgnify:CR=1 FL=1
MIIYNNCIKVENEFSFKMNDYLSRYIMIHNLITYMFQNILWP